eukprot:m.92613 g.92613  ORF g.92613 m.92613 type:complete len:768 (+) comp14671_c0_seq1:195-2498(+)
MSISTEEDFDVIVAQHALPAAEGDDMPIMFVHYTSKGAQKIDVFRQPWCRIKWSKARSNRYLSSAPVGAFIIRRATQRGQYVLSVQAGPRVCHVLIRAIAKDSTILYNVYPTPQWFENLYDLVLFCSYQPFQFPDLEGSGAITLSLEASQRAERLYRDLLVKNAVARRMTMVARRASLVRKNRSKHNSQTLSEAIIEEAIEDTETDNDSSRYSQGAVLFRGFLTKLGRKRKTWKRRFFELSSAGCLTYYKVAGQRQEMGFLDLRSCICVLPGGRCPVQWYANANPNFCFGIYIQNRQLYVYADSQHELQGWLQAITEVVPDGIPVTTPAQIEIEAKMRAALPPPSASGERKRLTVFRNGAGDLGQVVEVSTNWDELLAGISGKLGFPVTRLFSQSGGEFTNARLLRDDDVVFGSSGEDFIHPRLAAEERARAKRRKAAAERASKPFKTITAAQGIFGDQTGYDEPATLKQDQQRRATGALPQNRDDTYFQPAAVSQAHILANTNPENPAYLEIQQKQARSDFSDDSEAEGDYDNLDGQFMLDEPGTARNASILQAALGNKSHKTGTPMQPTIGVYEEPGYAEPQLFTKEENQSGYAELRRPSQLPPSARDASYSKLSTRKPDAPEEVGYEEIGYAEPQLVAQEKEESGYAEVPRPPQLPEFARDDTYMKIGHISSVAMPRRPPTDDTYFEPGSMRRKAQLEVDSSDESSPEDFDEEHFQDVCFDNSADYLSIADVRKLKQQDDTLYEGNEDEEDDPTYISVVRAHAE